MHRPVSAILAVSALAALAAQPAWAQAPVPLLPQPIPAVEKPVPVEEPPPGFNPLAPAEEGEAPVDAQPQAQPQPQFQPPPPAVQPVPLVLPAPEPAPAPQVPAVVSPGTSASSGLLGEGPAVAALILIGAFMAAMFGVMASMLMRRAELSHRRSAAATTLATELETRRQAFEAVPLPPNVEAGVFFVSAVTSLATIDAGFRAAQGDLHLLPAKLAASVSVHYAAVRRVADFVKGQSLAAAVRMLQANRIGGYPCPDAGTMRDAHEELTVAFRGIDKLIGQLNGQGR